jgi:hypothetical protein
MTTAGVSSASISSTVMVSVVVIWLDVKGVTLDTENRFPFEGWLVLQGRREVLLLAARYLVVCALCVQSAGD